MANGANISVDLSGFKEFSDKLKNMDKQLAEDTDEAAKFAAATWTQLASRAAPVDQGFLQQRISNTQLKLGEWEVTSPSLYSPFIEWGTKSLTSVPAELSAYASQFKGLKGGGDVKKLIYDWVLRKGLPQSAQWPIFIKIMRVGVKPHPFFFVQKPIVEKQFIQDLKQILNTPR